MLWLWRSFSAKHRWHLFGHRMVSSVRCTPDVTSDEGVRRGTTCSILLQAPISGSPSPSTWAGKEILGETRQHSGKRMTHFQAATHWTTHLGCSPQVRLVSDNYDVDVNNREVRDSTNTGKNHAVLHLVPYTCTVLCPFGLGPSKPHHRFVCSATGLDQDPAATSENNKNL